MRRSIPNLSAPNLSACAFVMSAFMLLSGLIMPVARAQEVRIISPQPSEAVRGEITVRFSGIPEGGYANIKVDGQFTQANAETTFKLNTFQLGDGTHTVSVTAINAAGKRVGEAEVSFEV